MKNMSMGWHNPRCRPFLYINYFGNENGSIQLDKAMVLRILPTDWQDDQGKVWPQGQKLSLSSPTGASNEVTS